MSPESKAKNPWEGLIVRPATNSTPVAANARPAAPAGAAHDPNCPAQTGGRAGGLRVLLVCEAGLFADAVGRSLAGLAKDTEVLRVDASEATTRCWSCDLVLVDCDNCRMGAVSLVRALRESVRAPLVALASGFDASSMTSILAAGAAGVLTKSHTEMQALGLLRKVLEQSGATARLHPDLPGDELDTTVVSESAGVVSESAGQAARRARNRNPYGLTNAEMGVLALLCEGLSNLTIAKRKGIREGTVKIHLNSIYQKLGVQCRTQAARIGERLDAIRDLHLKRNIEKSTLIDWLLPHMTFESHRKGETLFRRGEPGNALYFIHEGQVVLPELGIQLGAGEFLGEVGIFSPQHSRTCSARCNADTRLFRIDSEKVGRLYYENPRFAYHLMQVLAHRFSTERATL